MKKPVRGSLHEMTKLFFMMRHSSCFCAVGIVKTVILKKHSLNQSRSVSRLASRDARLLSQLTFTLQSDHAL